MSLIVRLQGLPAVADSFDIRQFFLGLNIPRGGVYITGGKFGEAYIVFATYEDARYSLSLSGRLLKDSYVRLTYSTEEEMRRALEVYQIGLKPSVSASYSPNVLSRGPDTRPSSSFSYIYVHGMPVKATKVEIREFFRGLLVEDVLFLKFINGIRNGNAIVKFGRSTDASEGLKLHSMPICGSPVTLKLSNEVEWIKNGGENVSKQRSPPRVYSRDRRRSRSRSRSPAYRRRPSRRVSPYVREYFVHIINLSYRADKSDIKKFFFDLEMKDSQINFLVDKEGKRTREAFAMFTTEKDYRRARSLDQALFKGHTLTILPISKRDMYELIDRMKVRVCKDSKEKKSPSRSSKQRRYLYLRNFAFDVTKADVQKFFTGKTVKEDDIVLLHDSKGVGLGEALVKFADEKEASKAEKENCEKYLEIKILISRIAEEQMKALQEANQADEAIVTEADDLPDFTSDSLPDLVPSVNEPPEQVNGEPSAMDSSEVEVPSESDSVPPPLDKEPEAMEGSNVVEDTAMEGADVVERTAMEGSDVVEKNAMEGSDVVENTAMEGSDVEKNSSVQDNPAEGTPEDAKGGDEQPPQEKKDAKKSEVTLLFVRNLPASVTAAEILDFFHEYKVTSVNLKNIERGIASVRMPSYAEAVSAIEALNKKEVGLKQVFLSLI